MPKPGDQMEIDPRNPPIVQRGGDVVIQDENVVHTRTIPGTGVNGGSGPPQIHEINGSTRGKSKSRKAKDEKRPRRSLEFISKLFTWRTKRPLSTMETQDLERWTEPEPSNSFAFAPLSDLVIDLASKSEGKPTLDQISEDNNTDVFVRAAEPSIALSLGEMPIQKEVVEVHPVTTEDEQVQEEDIVPVMEIKEQSQPEPQELQSESQEVSQPANTAAAVIGETGVPPVPMRAIPTIPTTVATPSSQDVIVGTNSNVAGSPASAPPLTSSNGFEEFDALENANSDFVVLENFPETKPATLGSLCSEPTIIPFQLIQRFEPPTPTNELSESILSSALSKGCNLQQVSQPSTITTDKAASIRSISDAEPRRSTQTLAHSEGRFASREGSVSSFTGSSRADSGSTSGSYSTRSNTPEPMGYRDEFIILQHENRGRSDKDRRGSEDNIGNQWEFRHAESQPRSSSLPTSRAHFVPILPGLDMKELLDKLPRRAE